MGSYPALDLKYSPVSGSATLRDLLYAALDDYQPLAIAEHETSDGWRVFFRERADRDAALAALRAGFGHSLRGIHPVDVPNESWARRSQEQLKAVRVGRLIIAPPWDVPGGDRPAPSADPQRSSAERPAPSADIIIVIDPSMGFGTGHHETTRLCLELMQRIEIRGRRVIDVGTGSGVLAIAAWKLGADSVVAIDNDPDALLNARDNIQTNGACDAIEVRQADLRALDVPPADVVLANLTGAVLQRHASALLAQGAAQAVTIVSGFSPEEAAEVGASFGIPTESVLTEGAWAALLMRKSNPA